VDEFQRVSAMTLLDKCRTIRLIELSVERQGMAGDIGELGVYKGGSAWVLAKHNPYCTVHLFDTFSGMPDLASGDDYHRAGEFADTSLVKVREYLEEFPNVAYHPGVFDSPNLDLAFSLVHLDADLYKSTLAGLKWFWPRLLSGGAMVLDDWKQSHCPGVERAVKEYFGSEPPELDESIPIQLTLVKP
jgi:O-methyltransferase